MKREHGEATLSENQSANEEAGNRDLRYRADADEELGEALLAALSEACDGNDETPLLHRRPLYDDLDVDALDDLFADRPSTEGRVRFEYDGRDVEVRSDGEIRIDEKSE